jgi:hypothetical protein
LFTDGSKSAASLVRTTVLRKLFESSHLVLIAVNAHYWVSLKSEFMRLICSKR